ncbi:monooxygenase [Spongisporangium articulatum]|uniref:Monooxygenase n=1 Tax=Spongisporangium articulatum TaxID=3362603 RepID=A0ABW8ASR1_9ACTN
MTASAEGDHGPGPAPAVVDLTIWGVPPGSVPGALARMARHRRPLAAAPGLRFAKLLGTGRGARFTPRDADPRHWALLSVWDGERAADAFRAGRVHRSWDDVSSERLDVRLAPVTSRGSWAGRQPFGPLALADVPREDGGPVAAITRARLRPVRALSFWRAVPPVAVALHAAPGVLLAIGIGEAPVGLQGTFSLWESGRAMREFAYRGAAHAEAIRRSGPSRWYAEELFARFAVRRVEGTYAGRRVSVGGGS